MKSLLKSLTVGFDSFINMKWGALLFLVVIGLPVTIFAYALHDSDNTWWSIAFAVAMSVLLYGSVRFIKGNLRTSEKLLASALFSSMITFVVVSFWAMMNAMDSSLWLFAGANLFAVITATDILAISLCSQKIVKSLLVCSTIFFMGMCIDFASMGINMLMDTPEWFNTVAEVITNIAVVGFILCIAITSIMFVKLSSEIKNPSKIYIQILSVMMFFVFLGMGSYFVFDLFGSYVPSLLNSIIVWGALASAGLLLLVGVVHLCAYAIDKITRS